MASSHEPRAVLAPRRPARDIVDAILHSMRENLEELKYSTLAPSRYVVYLHPAEYARLEGILPHLHAEALRALAESLDGMNRRLPFRRYADRVIGTAPPAVQNAGPAWHVEFIADPDESLSEGDILVESELLVPPEPGLGAGEKTRRMTTRHTSRPVAAPFVTASPVRARLVYTDADGPHTYDITSESVTLGRGGSAYPVDVRIAASPDVSREHARIRRDTGTGEFRLIDLSSLGTTLNGRHVPRGYDEVNGAKRENGIETPLSHGSRIGLAATVYLEFQVAPA
jgi:hypothetical protein